MWTAAVTEDAPGVRIAWARADAKGSVKGVITFHDLGDGLTRVLMVVEFLPAGLLGRASRLRLGRARRVRRDLQRYAAFAAFGAEPLAEAGEDEHEDVVEEPTEPDDGQDAEYDAGYPDADETVPTAPDEEEAGRPRRAVAFGSRRSA